jgi:hypothetical protein
VPCCCPSTPVRRVRTRGAESVRCMGTRMYTGQGMPAARLKALCMFRNVCHATQAAKSDFHATHSFEQTNKRTHAVSAQRSKQRSRWTILGKHHDGHGERAVSEPPSNEAQGVSELPKVSLPNVIDECGAQNHWPCHACCNGLSGAVV